MNDVFAEADSFTKDEFKRINTYFVSKDCSIKGIFDMTNDFEFELGNTYLDESHHSHPLTELSQSALCLISRSSEIDARWVKMKPKKTSVLSFENIRSSDKIFPKSPVNFILYWLPFSVSKKCGDDGTRAFYVYIYKRDSKIHREIHLQEDQLKCNIDLLKLPANFDNQKSQP